MPKGGKTYQSDSDFSVLFYLVKMKNTFAEIRCNGRTKKGFKCTTYLGHIQTDADCLAYFHCKECNKTKAVRVRDGIVSTRHLNDREIIYSPEAVALMGGT